MLIPNIWSSSSAMLPIKSYEPWEIFYLRKLPLDEGGFIGKHFHGEVYFWHDLKNEKKLIKKLFFQMKVGKEEFSCGIIRWEF